MKMKSFDAETLTRRDQARYLNHFQSAAKNLEQAIGVSIKEDHDESTMSVGPVGLALDESGNPTGLATSAAGLFAIGGAPFAALLEPKYSIPIVVFGAAGGAVLVAKGLLSAVKDTSDALLHTAMGIVTYIGD